MILRKTSLYLFINLWGCIIVSFHSLKAQNNRLLRLEDQYRYFYADSLTVNNELKLNIAYAFVQEGNSSKAEEYLNLCKNDSTCHYKYWYTYSQLHFIQDKFDESLIALYNIKESELTLQQLKDLRLLQIVNLNHLERYEEARQTLQDYLLQNKKDTSGLYDIYHKVSSSSYFDLKKAARKSRWLPGSGLVYVKERGKAGTSILLNTLFIGYTAYSIYTGYYVTAALTGIPQFLRFYNGGRKAAVNIGRKKNNTIYLNNLVLLDNFCIKKILEN